MSTSVKSKKARRKPEPSYRSIQLAILTELRKHTDLLSGIAADIAINGAREDFREKSHMCRVALKPSDAAEGLTSKSVLEDEMKRRGILRESRPGTA